MLSEKDVESVVKHEVGHYILNRYNNIVPTAIHFKYNSYDSLNGECEIQYNICLDIFSEVSKLSYQRAMVLFAGAAAEFLNFESKKIDQRKAKLDFEEKEISDNAKFSVHLITYLICEEKSRKNTLYLFFISITTYSATVPVLNFTFQSPIPELTINVVFPLFSIP